MNDAQKLDEIRALLDMEYNGSTWWEWVDGGLGGPFAENLRSILNDGTN